MMGVSLYLSLSLSMGRVSLNGEGLSLSLSLSLYLWMCAYVCASEHISPSPPCNPPYPSCITQDHLELLLQFSCREAVSLFPHMTPLSKLFIGLRWLLLRDGLGATNHMEATGFIRSAPGIQPPPRL